MRFSRSSRIFWLSALAFALVVSSSVTNYMIDGDFPSPFATTVYAQVGNDPCATGQLTTNATINATADVVAVAGTSGSVIYICGINVQIGGHAAAAGNARLQSGTDTTCQTGTVQMSGTIWSTSLDVAGFHGRTVHRGEPGADVCYDVGGSSPTVQGFISYVLGRVP